MLALFIPITLFDAIEVTGGQRNRYKGQSLLAPSILSDYI